MFPGAPAAQSGHWKAGTVASGVEEARFQILRVGADYCGVLVNGVLRDDRVAADTGREN